MNKLLKIATNIAVFFTGYIIISQVGGMIIILIGMIFAGTFISIYNVYFWLGVAVIECVLSLTVLTVIRRWVPEMYKNVKYGLWFLLLLYVIVIVSDSLKAYTCIVHKQTNYCPGFIEHTNRIR